MSRIDQLPVGQFASTLGLGPQLQGSQTGSLQGQSFTVDSDAGSLLDGAEEKSLFQAEKAESSAKKEDLKVRAGLKRLNVDRPPTADYFHKLKHAKDDGALQDAARQLMKSGGQGQGPLQLARQMGYDDPVQQYLLLDDALSMAQQEGAPAATQEALELALSDLERQHGREIRLDLATVDHASGFGRSTQEVKAMQTVAREAALGSGSLADTLKSIMDRMAGATGARLDHAIASLRQTLAALLAGVHPDTDKVLLKSLVDDLYQCNNLKTLLERTKKLVQMTPRGRARQGREQEQ